MSTTYRPAYRARVYAPPLVAGGAPALLTPRAGSAHSDAFQVASVQGVAGYQPYLDGAPRGRRSAVDPRDKKTDTGEWQLTLVDKRLGADNLTRWVTAFYGDAKGADQFKGCLVEVDECLAFDPLNPAVGWTRFATLRLTRAPLDGKVRWTFAVRELTDDLDVDVFRHEPHPSILPGTQTNPATGAWLQQAWPIGLRYQYGDQPAVRPAYGTVERGSYYGVADADVFWFGLRIAQNDGEHRRLVASAAGEALAGRPSAKGLVLARAQGTSDPWTTYALDLLNFGPDRVVQLVECETLTTGTNPDGTPRHAPAPAVGAALECLVVTQGTPPSKQLPLLVNEVHPVTMWRWLLDGKFSGVDGAGNPRWAIPYDAAAFAALEADASFPLQRWCLTEPATLNEWVEANICQPFHLAYALDAFGRVVPIDLRARSAVGTVATLTSADLTTDRDAAQLEPETDGAIAAVAFTMYVERVLTEDELKAMADPPSTGMTHDETFIVRLEDFSARTAVAVHGDAVEIKATGSRWREGGSPAAGAPGSGAGAAAERLASGTGSRREALIAYASGFASSLKGPFSLGPTYATLYCRRTSAGAALVHPGDYVVLDVDELPDPATNLRGGPRLAVCVERSEENAAVRLRCLDMGANGVAVAPALGVPAKALDDGMHALTVPVTVNAAGDPVHLQVAATPAGTAAAPAEGDAAWQTARANLTASGTVRVEGLLAGLRYWTRARSEPAPGTGLKLPSAWATSPTPVDTDTLAGVTGLAIVAGSLKVTECALQWDAPPAGMELEVYVALGNLVGSQAWTLGQRVALLRPGSTGVPLTGLDGPTVQQTVAVCAVNPVTGSRSAFATLLITTGAALPAAPRPAGLALASTFTLFRP